MGYYSGLRVMVMNYKISSYQLVTLNVCGSTASLIKGGEWCALNIAVQLDVHIIVMYYIIFKLQ